MAHRKYFVYLRDALVPIMVSIKEDGWTIYPKPSFVAGDKGKGIKTNLKLA